MTDGAGMPEPDPKPEPNMKNPVCPECGAEPLSILHNLVGPLQDGQHVWVLYCSVPVCRRTIGVVPYKSPPPGNRLIDLSLT